MRLFGYPYNDLVICKDSPDYLKICSDDLFFFFAFQFLGGGPQPPPPGHAPDSLQNKLMSILFCDHLLLLTQYTRVYTHYTRVTVAYNHVAYIQRVTFHQFRMYLCTCRLHRKYAVCEPYRPNLICMHIIYN